MNDVDKVIASAITMAHLSFSLRHFGSDDKSQIYYRRNRKCTDSPPWGACFLTGDNLKVVWAKFSTQG